MDRNNSNEIGKDPFLKDYPLSKGQAALWVSHKLNPGSAAYNLAGTVLIPEETNLPALYRAFQKVFERHPMLRTIFYEQHGKPFQRVASSSKISFQSEDASGWTLRKRDQRLREEVYRPFDLENGPTWKVVLFLHAPVINEISGRTSHGDHLVLLTIHHILADLWSIALITSEVTAFYQQEMTGIPAELKPLRSSYFDHVNSETERLNGPDAEKSWTHWGSLLSGNQPFLNFPTDQPRSPIVTGYGAFQPVPVSQSVADRLKALSQKEKVPPYEILLAAFLVLLQRYTGQDDILIGLPKTGRSAAMARVVGYFVNQTLVKVNFSSEPRFIDLLHIIHEQIKEGARFDWYPFAELVQRMHPDRNPDHAPVIQAVFSWQQAPRVIPRTGAGPFILGQANGAMNLNGLAMRSFSLPYRFAPFELMLLASESGEGFEASFEYALDLFDSHTVKQLADSFLALLESIASEPELRTTHSSIYLQVNINNWSRRGTQQMRHTLRIPAYINYSSNRSTGSLKKHL